MIDKNTFRNKAHAFRIHALAVILALLIADSGFADIHDIGPKGGYEAPAYVPPPAPVSRLHLVDNSDGTISDPDSGLMWTQKDSYAHLGKCLNWYHAGEYIENLRTGGHDDWRMPGMSELAGIYDNTKENVNSMDRDPDNPLALDEKFADGAAYWYWSSDHQKTDLADCCARTFYFATGMGHTRRFTTCRKGGVRGVRNID